MRYRHVVCVTLAFALTANDWAPLAAQSFVPPAAPPAAELTRQVSEQSAGVVQAFAAGVQPGSADAKTRVERMFVAIDKAERQIPRDHFDPKAIVAEVGKDPAALARWVQSHTALVPYRGSLRGPIGVLMDRAGNSLDRALLLNELLRLAGLQPRLARAQLSGADLQTVVAAADRPLVAERAAPADDPLPTILSSAGVDPAVRDSSPAALRESRTALAARVRARSQAQAAALLAAVKSYSEPPADGEARRRDALADHWWVQYRDGASWASLDPLPGSDSVGALVNPVSTVSATSLPADMLHRVRVRVLAEFWKDGAFEQKTVLTFAFAPSQWMGEPMSLRSVPLDGPDGKTLAAAPDPQRAILDAAANEHEWLPVLMIGNKPVVGYSFTDDGQLLDVSDPNALTMRLGRAVNKGTKNVEKFTDVLAGMPGGAPAPPPAGKPLPVLTAERVELELLAPGEAPETTRRTVFDLTAPGARAATPSPRPVLTAAQKLSRGLALFGEADLLATGCQLSQDYVSDLRLSRLVAMRDYLIGTMTSPQAAAAPPASARALPGPLYDLAVARTGWSSADVPLYYDRLNLFAYWRMVRTSEKGTLALRGQFDIIQNALAVQSRDPAAAFAARLAQGVSDTNAETILAGACELCRSAGNTSEAFAAAGVTHATWEVIGPRGRVAERYGGPPEARDAMAGDLSKGRVVVLPAGGAASGTWWRIDPKTGTALGVSGEGRGQEYAEYVMGLRLFGQFAFCELAVLAGVAFNHSSGAAASVASGLCLVGLGFGAAGTVFTSAALENASLVVQGLGAIIGAAVH